MNTTEIRIDLAKNQFTFSEINHPENITAIRFDNYNQKIELPLIINEYPNIKKLSFHGQSKENLFETPNNLEQLIHIQDLCLWRDCDFTKMKPMPQIEELYVSVKNVETETKQIITCFPNLKKIKIWGNFLKKQTLPNEIDRLISLESITLVECGLSNIPTSIFNLKRLKVLKLIGLPLESFPEVITQLEHLEILEVSSTLIKLPNNFSNLKNLKKLNLDNSLNRGNKQESKYLKPIPESIGKFKHLEELSLSSCGIFDITPITSLKKLKKLTLRYSSLKNCNSFSSFSHLQELDLANSYDLKDLDGLKGLHLKKLNLSSNYMRSIEIIDSLEMLEELDIESCDYIKDFSPIYKHNNLKELDASNDIIKNWKKRDDFKKLLPIHELIEKLDTTNTEAFEVLIAQLGKHVKANYIDEENPLASFFDIETEEEEITEIEILDQAIQKHIKNVSDTCLTTIFGMSFKSAYDNYNATLLVLEEIISRKNRSTQKKVIKQFYKACEYYDAGHRYWGFTVQDQLIDNFFPQFTSEALYQLLKKASTDLLNSQGGDQMDELFVPAFENTTDFDLQKKIIKVFFQYEEEARTYFGKEYFDTILNQIQAVALPELKTFLAKTKEKNKLQEALISDLENVNSDNLPKIITLLDNGISKKLEEEYLYNIVKAIQKNTLNEKWITQCLVYLTNKGEASYIAEILESKYHKDNSEKIILYFDNLLLEKNSEKNINLISEVIRLLLQDLDRNENETFEDLEIYRDYAVTICKEEIHKIYSGEIRNLLSFYFNRLSNHQYKNSSIWILDKIAAIFNRSENQFSYENLYYDTYYLVSDGENETCRTLFYTLCPKIKNYRSENILYLNIIASIKLNDEAYFDLLLKEIEKLEEITQVLLAYNLACGFAHFNRKKALLRFVEVAIYLGKTKEQFLEDTDFEKFWQDEDFLKAIANE